jgi:LUC7 N_terminus
MATEEARAMLDALMGGDRNAPLPKGAAIPGKRIHAAQNVMKRKKSCYDKDIDPLYTAWGVDCYDLFVNTKSDLGANPYIVDAGAHEEYLQLPVAEQERLGYHHILFQKLSELVRQCDRMIARNKEKLKQELNRKLSQRGYQDFVQDVDQVAVEQLARAMIALEEMTRDFTFKMKELEQIIEKEEDRKEKLELLFQKNRMAVASNSDEAVEQSMNSAPANIKVEEEMKEPVTEQVQIKVENVDDVQKLTTSMDPTAVTAVSTEDRSEMDALQTELGQLTLQKQRLVYDISQLITLLASQHDSVESQRRHLNYVKSDISTDKTVCEVSGNFMSSRDADERIAAHYSGKQYVGWKLVRDKLQSMIQKYGRHGPPPPGSRENGPPLPMSSPPPSALHHPPQNSGRGGYAGNSNFDREGAGGYYRGGSSGGGDRGSRGDSWVRHGPGGGPPNRGGYGNDRRPPPGGDRGWRR